MSSAIYDENNPPNIRPMIPTFIGHVDQFNRILAGDTDDEPQGEWPALWTELPRPLPTIPVAAIPNYPDEPQPIFTVQLDGSQTVNYLPKRVAIDLMVLQEVPDTIHVHRDGITIKAANAEAEYQVLGWNPIHKCLICERIDT